MGDRRGPFCPEARSFWPKYWMLFRGPFCRPYLARGFWPKYRMLSKTAGRPPNIAGTMVKHPAPPRARRRRADQSLVKY